MKISARLITYGMMLSPLLFGIVGCGKTCGSSQAESTVYGKECSAAQASVASIGNYDIYVSSGYPTASGVGLITRWTKNGGYIGVVHDFATNTGFMPQAVAFQTLSTGIQMLMLSFNGTVGQVDVANTDGSSFNNYFSNSAALAAGTRRMIVTSDGGYLITRTAGVERFNSAKQRVPSGAAKYLTTGACTITLGTAASQVIISGTEYVVASNAATTPNNKINLYNGATGACIAGVAPAGPATTMWPVAMHFAATINKLFVLYYPFTGATTNAQIWSFDVTAGAVNNGALLYNDIYADIAAVSATPAAQSSSIVYHETPLESFVLVGTVNNSVLKFSYDGVSLTKEGSVPLIYQNSFVRSISDVNVIDNND